MRFERGSKYTRFNIKKHTNLSQNAKNKIKTLKS
jgi:hypothetical protein